MDILLDTRQGGLVAAWSGKVPKLEVALKRLGFQFSDFGEHTAPTLTLGLLRETKKAAAEFGRVKASKLLREWVASTKARGALQHADSDADIAEPLLRDYPKTAEALRPYQRAGVEFIRTNNSVWLADHPGSGKTLQAIAGIVSRDIEGDILVLSPSVATQVTWPEEVERWAPDDDVLVVTGGRKRQEETLAKLQFESKTRRRWVLCNLEMARMKYNKPVEVEGRIHKGWWSHHFPELFFLDYGASKPKNKRLWAAVIVDESHRALTTTKSQPYKQSQIRAGMGNLAVKPGGLKLAVSGTPFRGKLENAWGTLNWLARDEYKNFYGWAAEWFEVSDRAIHTMNGEVNTTTVGDLLPGREPLFYEDLARFMLRRTKKEIAPWLPDKTYAGTLHEMADEIDSGGVKSRLVGHWLNMGTKQGKAYRQMEEEAIANLDSGTLIANGVLAEMTRLKQFAGTYGKLRRFIDSDGFEDSEFLPELPSNKLDWLFSYLDEIGINKDTRNEHGPHVQKIVIASQFTRTINLFAETMEKKGIDTVRITGQVGGDDRAEAVREFQSDDGAKVMLLNTLAGGVALTLDRADDLVILDETFIPDDQEQVEDRIHRVSRNHKVTIHYLRTLGTIEESIALKTAERDDLQKRIIDGERGVEYARSLL